MSKLKEIIRRALIKRGINLTRVGENSLFLSNLYALSRKRGRLKFLQIGANDGQRFDPLFRAIRDLKMTGIAIEPVPEYYAELVANCRGLDVTPLNCAVYIRDGEVEMHKVKSMKNAPEWAKGIASLDPTHHRRSGIDAALMEVIKVRAVTFETLMREHDLSSLDVLQIDTEGFDYELMTLFPLKTVMPKLINFEHGIYDGIMSRQQFCEIATMLVNHGYYLSMADYDCMAYLPRA